MRLVSWNVAGRVRRRDDQGARIRAEEPDLVVLQEVSKSTLDPWRADLAAMGLMHVVAAADFAGFPDGRRGLTVLVASRAALRPLEQPPVPWPERVLAVETGGLAVCGVHSPVSQRPDLVKVRTHEALRSYLAAAAGSAWLVTGDFNTPRREHPDGTIWTFARESNGKLRPERGERWDAAERALLRGLAAEGFRDAFRELHGYSEREPTWTWPNGGGYRLDHLVVSAPVAVTSCAYRHDWRTSGLSDHSALVAEVALV